MENGLNPFNHREVDHRWRRQEAVYSEGQALLESLTAYEDCPRDLLLDYGYDAVRLYELFTGRSISQWNWEDGGIDGVYRFLSRFWLFVMRQNRLGKDKENPEQVAQLLVQMKGQLQACLEKGDGHGAVASFMTGFKRLKLLARDGAISRPALTEAVRLLQPMAPATALALLEELGAGSE